MDLTAARWCKSSYSSGDGANGDCVEVGFIGPAVAVRDSKVPAFGALVFSLDAWRVMAAMAGRQVS